MVKQIKIIHLKNNYINMATKKKKNFSDHTNIILILLLNHN